MRLEFREAFCSLRNELRVVPVVLQDGVHHPVDKGHVRTEIEPDVNVGCKVS